jgi:hypothetical protein
LLWAAIMPGMTLVEITYELQSPLTQDQLRRLGEFSNTYGLRRFHFDEIAHVLGQATIAVAGRVDTAVQPTGV